MVTAALRIIGLLAALSAVPGCGTGGPPPPVSGPFDGIWTSSDLGYDFLIEGSKGRAIGSSRVAIHVDDPVFELVTLEPTMRFKGKQLLPDGVWHEFTGELKADGRLSCTDGQSVWVLERKPL
ncbi:MAG: hypothetical protein NNA24_00180 [Nitrospira sp.]|nr:hypothetical protein [Nitrospira sp.]